MKIENIYDTKLVIIDINFHTIESWNLDYVLSMQKILKQLAATQNLLIVTNSSHNIAINTIDSWSLQVGHLIANSGSCIYNIALKKIIEDHIIEKELAKIIVKLAIWKNLNFVINTKNNNSYIFKINSWLLEKYKTDLSYLIALEKKTLNSWNETISLIKTEDIYSLEILFNEDIDSIRNKKMTSFCEKINEFCEINYSINGSILYIFPIQASKYDSINNISQEKKILLSENSIYIAIDQYCPKIIENSYFSILADDFFVSKEIVNIEKKQITDVFNVGQDNWVKWLTTHSYLWTEPVEQIYKSMFLFASNTDLNQHEINSIKKKEHKFLYWNKTSQEITISDPAFGHKFSWFGNKKKSFSKQDIQKIFFWESNIDLVINYLNNKNVYK